MFQIDPMSRQPVYEQIIEQIERYVLNRVLQPGDQIPSVRSLSLDLSINPNTIQKAYAELDRRNIIQSVPGKGCFIRPDVEVFIAAHMQSRLDEFKQLLSEMKRSGIGEDKIMSLIKEVYGND